MNNEVMWANPLGYNLNLQARLDEKYYSKLKDNLKKYIDDYEKYELAVKNFLCKEIPTQQVFYMFKMKISEYQKLKLIECINFLDGSGQLLNMHLIFINKQPAFFSFFTDNKIIVKQKK